MANYYGTWRSNYFTVNDVEAFKADLKHVDLEIIEEEHNRVCLLQDGEGGIPAIYYDDDYQDVEIFWGEIFKKHLAPDEVAVLVESGHEKLRYLFGIAVAFDCNGDEVSVALGSIYEKAAKAFGVDVGEISVAEY